MIVRNGDSGKVIQVLGEISSPISDIQFNASGKEFVTASVDGIVSIRSGYGNRGKLLRIKACWSTAYTASFSLSGTQIVVACGNRSTAVFDAQTGQPLTTLNIPEGAVVSAEFSRTGNSVVTAADDRGHRRGANLEFPRGTRLVARAQEGSEDLRLSGHHSADPGSG